MADQPDNSASRPYWFPNTQGFLAIAIVVIMGFVLWVLLNNGTFNPSERVYGALLTLLGVIAAVFKDVYGWAFGSSQKEEKKDDAIAAIAAQPSTPAPTAPVPPWWSRLSDAEKNAITAAATADPRVTAFVSASQVGAANADDLAYLVQKGLLTQARADEIKAS